MSTIQTRHNGQEIGAEKEKNDAQGLLTAHDEGRHRRIAPISFAKCLNSTTTTRLRQIAGDGATSTVRASRRHND